MDTQKGFGPCNPANDYGYLEKKPCIFLKLNKIYAWEPRYYDKADLPLSMPKDLKNHIEAAVTEKMVWVSCEGEDPADKENIGELRYYTDHGYNGFNGNFYPFENQEGYLQPLVAVQFMNVTSKLTVNIFVEFFMPIK